MKGAGIIIFALILHTTLSQNEEESNNSDAPLLNDGKVNYTIDSEDGKVTYMADLKEQSYAYRLETSDGTIKHEEGHFEEDGLVVEGGYEYIGDDGVKYSVTYVADKNGYRPKVSFGLGSKSASGPVVPPVVSPIAPPTTSGPPVEETATEVVDGEANK